MRPKNEDCRDQITLGGGVFVRRAHLQKAQNAAANVIASTLVTKQGAFKAALLAEDPEYSGHSFLDDPEYLGIRLHNH